MTALLMASLAEVAAPYIASFILEAVSLTAYFFPKPKIYFPISSVISVMASFFTFSLETFYPTSPVISPNGAY